MTITMMAATVPIMPLFIYSLLNRNGLKFGYGPSRVMISGDFDVTRVTLSDCRAQWFRPVPGNGGSFGEGRRSALIFEHVQAGVPVAHVNQTFRRDVDVGRLGGER